MLAADFSEPIVGGGVLAATALGFAFLRWVTRTIDEAERLSSQHKDEEIVYYKAALAECRDENRLIRNQLRAIMAVARSKGWEITDELTG